MDTDKTIDSSALSQPTSVNEAAVSESSTDKHAESLPGVSSAEMKNDSQQQAEFSSDIGFYINDNNLDDFKKASLLERHWSPPSEYNFPYCTVTKKGKPTRKYAQRSHLEKFHWLVLSPKDQGLYCKYCVLFAKGLGGGFQKNTCLKRLVKEPLKDFDDLLGKNGKLTVHEQNQYHQLAVEAGKNFLLTYHQPGIEIVNQLDTRRQAEIKENRERLKPIIKTIIFSGRQNISSRGHRDDGGFFHSTNDTKGKENQNQQTSVINDGNFRALLRFRIDAGDTQLQHHLETASANATYISKTVQNQIIDVCKLEIQEIILNRVKEAGFFAIIFDETTDISRKVQLSLSFRIFYNGQVREDFITFCDAYKMIQSEDPDEEPRLTGIALGNLVLDICKNFDVDIIKCVGIGTDSCTVMASETKGAVQEIIKTAIYAKRCPCNNHILNNSLGKSSNVPVIRNTSDTMRKVVAFFNASGKRHLKSCDALDGSTLQGICETRWVERHDGHLQFQGDTLFKICKAFEAISTWKDAKTASDAQALLYALQNSDFIVSTICLCDVLGKYFALKY